MKDFPDYRLLLDEQAEQTFAITDDYGARAQDWRMLRFISDISRRRSSKAATKNPLRVKMNPFPAPLYDQRLTSQVRHDKQPCHYRRGDAY
jgi:hypothetical protein